MTLVAKNGGEIRLHHFAHSSNTKGATCFQTMIHRFAKDILNEITEFKICDRDNRIYKINNVYLETKIQDIIPDIILETDNGIIFIEIYVTHQLDYDKKMKIIDLDIPTVEYDLSKIDRNITKAELKNILVNKPKVRWLYVKSDKRF